MARQQENTAFTCVQCGARVTPVTNGSYRNHCPCCLWSLHVDDVRPGDRAARCRAPMEPVGVIKKKKGFQIVHRCIECGKTQPNVVALDTIQADEFDALVGVMRGGLLL